MTQTCSKFGLPIRILKIMRRWSAKRKENGTRAISRRSGQLIPNIDSYDVVFLGFPIWGMTAPPVIRSFLSGHDLSGKTVIPFVTHGGYGRGTSMAVVAEHAPRARLLEGFTMQADQERETLSQVTRWLGGIQTGK